MKYRTPLANVRGLGSAKEGTHHFWVQRLTAVALIPLGLWFLVGVVSLTGADYATAAAWIGKPLNTVLLVGLVIAVFYHAQLGLQVVVEDYIHTRWQKLTGLLILKLGLTLMGIAAVVAILRVALGG